MHTRWKAPAVTHCGIPKRLTSSETTTKRGSTPSRDRLHERVSWAGYGMMMGGENDKRYVYGDSHESIHTPSARSLVSVDRLVACDVMRR
jgi:hypothetical protein